VTEALLPDAFAPLSGPLEHLSTGDAHLSSSKMHAKATRTLFSEKSDRAREEFALRLRIPG